MLDAEEVEFDEDEAEDEEEEEEEEDPEDWDPVVPEVEETANPTAGDSFCE